MKAEEGRVSELLDLYLSLMRDGKAPAMEDFIAQHPDEAPELKELLPFIADLEMIGKDTADSSPAATTPPPNLEGSDFRIIDEISSGGMGTVYRARQLSLNRDVALKVISPSLIIETPGLSNRLMAEARTVANLYHPNIVRVHTAGKHNNVLFYTMDLIPGVNLAKDPPKDPRAIADIGRQAASALAYANSCGVIHCDIKPSNLFLEPDGTLKVGDFGLSLSLAEGTEQVKAREGTLRYMAPERLRHGEASPATDQYSLGATLYEFATGRPFRIETDATRLCSDMKGQAVPPPDGVPPDLAAIIQKSLAPDPARRYPSMTEFADDLARFLDNRPVQAAHTSICRRLHLWSKRDPLRAAACAAACICATGFVAALALGLIHTHRALSLAKNNAEVANSVLNGVFQYVKKLPPSSKDTQLLATLLPYFDKLAHDEKLSAKKRMAMRDILVRCAIRAGRYDLAEPMLRHMIDTGDDRPEVHNRLAHVLKKMGRDSEAKSHWKAIVSNFSEDPSDNARLIAVRAILQSDNDPNGAAYAHAYTILRDVLSRDASNPHALFAYAKLLLDKSPATVKNPIPGLPTDPMAMLNSLVEKSPDTAHFALYRLQTICGRLKEKSDNGEELDQQEIQHAFKCADELYTKFANMPGTASTVFHMRATYLDHMVKQHEPPPRIMREAGRLEEFTSAVFKSSSIPNSDKEIIIEDQLRRLGERLGSPRRFARMARNVRAELEKFTGKRSREFHERIDALEAQVTNDMNEHDTHFREGRHRHSHQRQ